MAGFDIQAIVGSAAKRNGKSGTPEPGTTEHALFLLVLLEMVALVLLRKYFKAAHGG